MLRMNKRVRQALDHRLLEKGMSRADLARAIGRKPQTVTRALNGNVGGGEVPPLWAAMLEALELTITAIPCDAQQASNEDNQSSK